MITAALAASTKKGPDAMQRDEAHTTSTTRSKEIQMNQQQTPTVPATTDAGQTCPVFSWCRTPHEDHGWEIENKNGDPTRIHEPAQLQSSLADALDLPLPHVIETRTDAGARFTPLQILTHAFETEVSNDLIDGLRAYVDSVRGALNAYNDATAMRGVTAAAVAAQDRLVDQWFAMETILTHPTPEQREWVRTRLAAGVEGPLTADECAQLLLRGGDSGFTVEQAVATVAGIPVAEVSR